MGKKTVSKLSMLRKTPKHFPNIPGKAKRLFQRNRKFIDRDFTSKSMLLSLSQSVEDYLEIIYRLEKKKGFARTSDISSFFGHKPSSVTGMIQKLDEQGYVNYEKYGGVTLTGKGKRIAKKVSERHETLTSFLKILGVDEGVAEEDACRIEHSVHKETMERLRNFVSFVQNAPKDPKWLRHFEYFIKTGKHPKMNEK